MNVEIGIDGQKAPACPRASKRECGCALKSRQLCEVLSVGFLLAFSMAARAVPTQAAPLARQEFAAFASRCAAGISPNALEAVALTESGMDPWALHDNRTGVSDRPASFDAAYAEAQSWLGRGDSVDLGLMQINSANLSALGLTARTALDPCVSIAGGSAVLRAAYGNGGTTPADRQVALLIALSRYNTGSPFKGILNGYARRVMARVDGYAAPPTMASSKAQTVASDFQYQDPNAPAAWNVGAVGAYAQTHGAPWLIALASTSAERPLALPGHSETLPTAPMSGFAEATSGGSVSGLVHPQSK